MTRINRSSFVKNIAERKIAESRNSESRNSESRNFITWGKNTGALVFAALLIVCSLAVGCNSDKPKPVSSNNPIPVTQNQTPNTMLSSNTSAALAQPAKPAQKKVVRKRPATVTYADQTYGVTFDYPRKYGLETGNAANELVASSPLPMNFVVPGGIALAAVELPETAFADTDLSAAYFNVSVNKDMTAEQCGEFAVPQPKAVASTDTTQAPAQPASTEAASTKSVSSEVAPTQPATTQSAPAQNAADQTAPASTTATASASAPATPATTASAATTSTPVTSAAATTATASSSTSKLMLGDLELQSAEAVAGEGNQQSDTKYFHVFQNGGCYEFALNVTTMAHETEGTMKHVDRDKVFNRLAAIMASVKINPVAAPEVTASAPAASAVPSTPVTPAQ
ncbi:MAG: hypothetical protein WBQ08_23435 [Candidatus Sulfotelmatobacter sp.]